MSIYVPVVLIFMKNTDTDHASFFMTEVLSVVNNEINISSFPGYLVCREKRIFLGSRFIQDVPVLSCTPL